MAKKILNDNNNNKIQVYLHCTVYILFTVTTIIHKVKVKWNDEKLTCLQIGQQILYKYVHVHEYSTVHHKHQNINSKSSDFNKNSLF